jgi:hypothetical protein
MSERRSFVRKVVYLCAIGLLLVPVSWLSAPATRSSVSGQGSSGGKLARLRADYKLSQANLGEIDPASETIKLATLGMRGIAANLLWEKANHYKMTEDWTSFSATLEQITKLQPNFVTVWQYQAWNLSYNVSYEFDDYRDRYYWVMRGIDFLEDGTRYNENDPQLLWDMGWFLGYKIGRADEHVLYRRLFKNDEEYHPADRPREMRDNWLLGKQWLRKAQYAVDNYGKDVKGRTDLIFHSYPALWQMYYAATIESEGVFGEVARRAWATAAEDWQQYGQRMIPMYDNTVVQLGRLEYYRQQVDENQQQLDALAPGLTEIIEEERRQRCRSTIVRRTSGHLPTRPGQCSTSRRTSLRTASSRCTRKRRSKPTDWPRMCTTRTFKSPTSRTVVRLRTTTTGRCERSLSRRTTR